MGEDALGRTANGYMSMALLVTIQEHSVGYSKRGDTHSLVYMADILITYTPISTQYFHPVSPAPHPTFLNSMRTTPEMSIVAYRMAKDKPLTHTSCRGVAGRSILLHTNCQPPHANAVLP